MLTLLVILPVLVEEPFTGVANSLLNYGVLGAVVLVLGWVAWKLDSERKQLYMDRIAAEQRFANDKAEMVTKYREALERLNQTLDALTRLVAKITGGG
jgi:hypothetical protein